METIGYHGTKVDFDEFVAGTASIDRMVGPHFSKTPASANRFALRNPARKGNGKRAGGRVIPVRLGGLVYTVNQRWQDFPGAKCRMTHPETGNWYGLYATDYYTLAEDIGKVVLTGKPVLLARYASATGHDSPEACLGKMVRDRDWRMASVLKDDIPEQATLNRLLKYIPTEAAFLRLRGSRSKVYRIVQFQREFHACSAV